MSTDREIIKQYKNEDLTVFWKPKKCIHAAECVSRLPKVYHPEEKPWIKIENATTAALMEQIDACPSGALSYALIGSHENTEKIDETKVTVKENGPLLIFGALDIEHSNGHKEQKDKATAFCRCGASANKPYCDGTHAKIDFKG